MADKATTTTIGALADDLGERLGDAPLRIGSRTSAMALAQTDNVTGLLHALMPDLTVETVPIRTSGDLWQGDLARLGGKGNFTKEIDRALLAGQIDVAVHCMKDVPGDVPLPPGTEFAAYLPRGDVHDVLVTREGRTLSDLPAGSRVGTSSVRRRAQLGLYRPDLTTERVRGGVDTRIKKLDNGDYDALLLARAGLQRLGMTDRITETLPTVWGDESTVAIVPAVGAAVIGIQARSTDTPITHVLEHLNDADTARHIMAERTMLHMLRGHCNSPIAGHASTTPDEQLSLYGMVFNRDGTQWVRSHEWGPGDDPATLGAQVAADLLKQGARRLITATRQ